MMDKEAMINVARTAMKCQDEGDVEGQLALYAEDCTFLMPVSPEPMQGLEHLRKSVEAWPKAVTNPEWFAADGNRLVAAWNWRGDGWPEETPLLRGV